MEDDLICVAKDFNYKSISIHILTRRMTDTYSQS